MRQRDVEAGRTSHLCKKGNDLADTFAKKGQTHTSLLFESPRHLLPVLPWPSKRHVGRPKRTFCSAAAPRSRVRPPRARVNRKEEKGTAAPAAGQVSDWLSPMFPSRFSQDSHLDPRSFRGHSLQLGRVFDAGGRALDNAIIFCAKCGAVYWERADALCRQCSEFPGGRASQLRKLRSGLFPNERYPGWTVEHVRRPTLDEAATLVAQLESCEAGLGRTVMGPTTPKKQRVAPQAAVLTHWERVGEFAKTLRCSVSTSGGRSCGRRIKAHPQGWQCSLSQARLIWQYKSVSIVCPARPKRDFGVMCAVGCDGSSSSESEAEPHNIWNALLAALVHSRIGEVLQPLLTSEEVGCVALSCHFASDALCAELYNWARG